MDGVECGAGSKRINIPLRNVLLAMMGGAAVFATQVGFAVCSLISGRLAEINLAYPMVFGAALMGTFALAFFISPLARTIKKGKADI